MKKNREIKKNAITLNQKTLTICTSVFFWAGKVYLCYTRFFSAELNLVDTILQYVSIKNNIHEIKCIKPNQINIQQHKYFGIDKIILVLNMHFDIRFNICGSQSTLSIYLFDINYSTSCFISIKYYEQNTWNIN